MIDEKALLKRLGASVRQLRKQRSWSRRDLAQRASVSERFLADIELGRGNPSVLRLAQLGEALEVGLPHLLEAADGSTGRSIALLGLRGAGKSTVGPALAERLKRPFVELDQAIEEAARLSLNELFQMHDEAYYRRVEHEVLRGVLSRSEPVVLATGGGVVTSPPSFDLLRESSDTVWLHAKPEDHWERVVSQGDTRPMAGNDQAFLDLCSILQQREPLYRSAKLTVETSGRTVDEVCDELEAYFAA